MAVYEGEIVSGMVDHYHENGQTAYIDVEENSNYDEPIDNSDVLEADKTYRFRIIPAPQTGDRMQWAFDNLKSSIEALKRDYPAFKRLNTNNDAQYLIDLYFSDDFTHDVYFRNISYDDTRRQKTLKNLGVRVKRAEGDELAERYDFSLDKTLLFEGYIDFGKTLVVSKIVVIDNTNECLPYETECTVQVVHTPNEVRVQFLKDLLTKAVSLNKYTDKKLTEWNEYLDWNQRISEVQLKGCKYIEVQLDKNNNQLIFTMISESKEKFDFLRRALGRDVMAYTNNWSEDEWIFSYRDEFTSKRRRERGTRLGSQNFKKTEEFYLLGNEQRLFSKNYNPGDHDLKLENIQKAFENPYIAKLHYELYEEDLDALKQDNLTDDEVENIYDEILNKYPRSGFLALSAVGTFALIKRFRNTISQLKNGENFSPRIGEWLFDSKNARNPDEAERIFVDEWYNKKLNPSQKEAVLGILNSPDLFLLQGPPGTGKTTVIAEAILQLVKRGKSVLLSSQSNDAVDNALDRLAETPEIRALRLDPSKNFKKRKNEDTVQKFSEDTALQYFYKSIAKKVSDSTIGKWESNEKNIVSLQHDINNLRNYQSDFNRLQNEYTNLTNKRESLRDQRRILNEELNDANSMISEINNQKIQIGNFKDIVSGLRESVFVFSDSQFERIESLIKGYCDYAKSQGFVLSDFDFLSSMESKAKSTNLLILIQNINLLKQIVDKSSRKEVDETQNNPELALLKSKVANLDSKLNNPDLSESEYTKLLKEYTTLRRKLRELERSSSSISLTEEERKLFLPETAALFNQKSPVFIQNANQVLNSAPHLTNMIVSELEKFYATSLTKSDGTSITEQLKVIEGQLKVTEDDLLRKAEELSAKQNTVKNLSKKHELGNISSMEMLMEEMNQKLRDAIREDSEEIELKNEWGDVFKRYIKKLEDHSTDAKLVELDKDNYMSTYVRACNVVGMSCTANPRTLSDNDFNDFDVVIIDEVSKATPPELLIPLMKARSAVLVGDHRQLPPIFNEHKGSYRDMRNEVLAEDDSDELKDLLSDENFDRFKHMVTSSLFKEAFENADPKIKGMLDIQFRMHPDIMNIINRFYEKQLKNSTSMDYEDKKKHCLNIRTINDEPFIKPAKHAYWIDSSNVSDGSPQIKPVYEIFKGNSTSACNLLEEELAVELIKKLAEQYKDPEVRKTHFNSDAPVSVGVISFYQKQINDIRTKIKAIKKQTIGLDIDVNTVDRFQGKEKQIIIVSLVRNNKQKRYSEHVTSFERINVAFSRAQNLLVILGAKDFYNEVEVKLPAMNRTGAEQTVKVYHNIMEDLRSQGCFKQSDVLISAEKGKEILEENKQYQKPDNSKRGRR